jgi:PTS system cellobiose-specific IIB component
MAEKTVMLVCAAGMSTSLLVASMQKAAVAAGKDYNIFATASADADNKIAEEHPDVLMLGPQIRYLEGEMKKKADAAGIPMEIINMQDYGMMKGDNVLKEADRLMGV